MNSFQSFLNTKVNIDQRALLDQTFQSALKKFDKNKKGRSYTKYQPQNYSLTNTTSSISTNKITSQPYSSTRLTSFSNQNFNSNITPSASLKSDFGSTSLSKSSNYFLKSSKNAPSYSDNDDESYDQSISEFHFEPYEKEISYTEKYSKVKNDEFKFQLNPNRNFSKEEKNISPQLNLQQPKYKEDLSDRFQQVSPVPSSSFDSIQIQAPIINQDDQIQTKPQISTNSKQEPADRNKEEEIKQFREHLKKRILLKKERESEEKKSSSNIDQKKECTGFQKNDDQPISSIQYRKSTNIPIDQTTTISPNSSLSGINNAKIDSDPVKSSRFINKFPQSLDELQEKQESQFDCDINDVLSKGKNNLNINEDNYYATNYNIKGDQKSDITNKFAQNDNFSNYSSDTMNSNLKGSKSSISNSNCIKNNLNFDENNKINKQLNYEDERATIKDYSSKFEKSALNDKYGSIKNRINNNIENDVPSNTTFNCSSSENMNKSDNLQPSKIVSSRSDQFGKPAKENLSVSPEQDPKINSSLSLNEIKSQAQAQFTKDREYLTQMQDGIKKEREIANSRLLDSRPTDLINAFKQRMMNFTSRTIGCQPTTTPSNEEMQADASNCISNSTINTNKSNSFLVENDELSSFGDEDLNIQSQNLPEFNYSFNENNFNLANDNDSDENADSSFDSSCFVQLKEFADAHAADFENIEDDFSKEFTNDPNENNDQ